MPLEKKDKKQIRNLSDIASMGGNYLLNVGPKEDGTILEYEKNVLNGVGNWMKINSEAIYDTQTNPFVKSPWGKLLSTQKTTSCICMCTIGPKTIYLKFQASKIKLRKDTT